jgi:hypothetical protein
MELRFPYGPRRRLHCGSESRYATGSAAQSQAGSGCLGSCKGRCDTLAGCSGLGDQVGVELFPVGQPAFQGATFGQDSIRSLLNGGLEFRMAAQLRHLRV